MYHVWIAENLFHYKKEQTKYSIKPEHYDKLPLFLEDKDTNSYLNEFFFFVFSKVWDWQCLKELDVGTSERKMKDKEESAGVEAEADPNDTVHDVGEGAGLEVSEDEGTDPAQAEAV